MTNAEFAAIAALVARRAAIWTHEAIGINTPDEEAPANSIARFVDDITRAMVSLPRQRAPVEPKREGK